MLTLHRRLTQTLPRWAVWLLYIGVGMVLAWLLMFGLALWVLNFGLKPNPKRLYRAFFVNPLSDVRQIQGGGFSWLGHDYWVQFQSDKPAQLKDSAGFASISLEKALSFYTPEDGCKPLLRAGKTLEILYRTKSETSVGNGVLFVHDRDSNTYCYQDWYLD